MTTNTPHETLFELIARGRPEHALFSASTSSRWTTCLGYHEAVKDIPRSTSSSPAAERGTYAHKVLEDCLTHSLPPHAFTEDEEVQEWVGFALDYVSSYETQTQAKVFPEVYVPWYFVSGGTIDILGIHEDEYLIADFKTGNHPVFPENNTQLIIYALAVRHLLGKRDRYRLTILQPPTHWLPQGPIREWVVEDEILASWESRLMTSILNNIWGGRRHPGDHCRWCPAEATCVTKAQYVLSKVQLNLYKEFLEPV